MKKIIIEVQVNRLEKDKKEILDGISKIENQIQELQKQVERNRGAFAYAHILSESLKQELAELEKNPA